MTKKSRAQSDRRDANRAKGLCACGNEPEQDHRTCRSCIDRVLDARRRARRLGWWEEMFA